MKKKGRMTEKKMVLLLSFLHFMVSVFVSRDFFVSIREGTGSENIAYKYFSTGMTLPDDMLSRVLCQIYSYALAYLLIAVFYSIVFRFYKAWKLKTIECRYMAMYLFLVVLGLAVITIIYPRTVVAATDTTWNYIYAKEWLPIYWHGYLTNVIHCACMIIFPHPIAMSMIPYLFGITEICYFTYITIIKVCSKNKLLKIVCWAVFLLLMPETFLILTYAGRNYMFALLSVGYIGIFLKDYLWHNELSGSKFVILSFMAAVLGTWRSEGVIYLIFFPVLLFFTYYYGREQWRQNIKQKCSSVAFVLLLYLVLALPGNYGSEKYQGYDYAIINTPAPLSVVFNDENANLSYEGAQDDLNTVYSVVPKEYFEKYGKLAQFYYGFDQLNSPRQAHAGEDGKKYITSTYRILLHNLDLYLKNQINFFTESIGIGKAIPLREPVIENWTENTTPEALAWFDWIWAYFSIGEENISSDYDIVILSRDVDAILNRTLTTVLDKIYSVGWSFSGWIKLLVTIIVCVITLRSLVKKEWAFFFTGVLILGIHAAIILTAPAMRENYYYSPYFNQYWYILFYACYVKNKGGCWKREKEVGERWGKLRTPKIK